ncbi:hypothetical protein NPIL_624271 [Nephila pilipes]|uniref:Uncharacterized protein n=1 Tax=Nephila pilipes TaxID=299642 RepID=A0A8X6NPC5_NEPPI|nr:hypothetical protein NPIL_624271 [Nephila pilipes]
MPHDSDESLPDETEIKTEPQYFDESFPNETEIPQDTFPGDIEMTQDSSPRIINIRLTNLKFEQVIPFINDEYSYVNTKDKSLKDNTFIDTTISIVQNIMKCQNCLT